MIKKLRICFFGSPEFAIPSLDKLIKSEHNLISVFSQPPKPAKRGKKIFKQPIHRFSEENGIKVFCPEDLNNIQVLSYLKSLELDLIVVVAYGNIIPKGILDLPVFGCINLHASLLPRWRGAAPIQRAIMSGDKKSGVSIMLMDEGLDSGPILKSLEVKIGKNDNYMQLSSKLSTNGAALLIKTIQEFVKGNILPEEQNKNNVTYANKILKKDQIIKWNLESLSIVNLIKSLSPYPGAKTKLNGEIIKIINAEPVSFKSNADYGTVLNGDLCIKCGKGSIKIMEIQRPGKRIMSAKDVLNGWKINKGMKVE